MKKDKEGCDGKSCLLCRLSVREWDVAIASHKKNFRLAKGETLFKEGDEVTGIYFVYEGIVKVHKHWGADKELIIRFAKPGDIVGHRGIGGTDLRFPVTATALTPARVCFVAMDFFQSSLHINHHLLYELMLFYAQELQTSEKQMRNLAHMSVKGRAANALLLLQQQFGRTDKGFINITLHKQDLASYIGTTYETVFRVLNELISDKLIILSGKDIKIADKAGLKQFL
ncbi:MAG TPA: Crp/Fnr family transcriptional regulator [Chitinophaga sp.]|uniref:Crp/Fnr family transcriptional regulator n=1 Tax=Chitinophaga sp. TaxID=1869181 RepID=UPI002C779C6B|nr:Crp/Fnr family transcriptional regulator [Chitinophaga sp.]HVI47034.1 Crp/Fnr family transcriptional regulator [Chitinophaga sp.]